jgi:hypothetical protein
MSQTYGYRISTTLDDKKLSYSLGGVFPFLFSAPSKRVDLLCTVRVQHRGRIAGN